MSTHQQASPPTREWPSVHPEQAVSLLTHLLLTLAGVWAPTHKLNKAKLDLLPRGLFHQCQWWHLIAGLTSHICDRKLPADLLLTPTFCFWLKILLHPNPQVFVKKAEIPKALFGVLPQSLWFLSGGSIARRGSDSAEGSIKSAITAALPSAVGLKSVKECPGVGPKAEQSGIRCIGKNLHSKGKVCSDHSRYCFKSHRNWL